MVNYRLLASHMFYQLVLLQAYSLPLLTLPQALSLFTLLSSARPAAGEEEINLLIDKLIQNKEVLDAVFSIGVSSDGCLLHIPQVINGITPLPHGLPDLISRVANTTFYDSEVWYHDVAKCLSLFYVCALPTSQETTDDDVDFVSCTVLPAIKAYLQPQKSFTSEKIIVEIASLDQLYKVFERC